MNMRPPESLSATGTEQESFRHPEQGEERWDKGTDGWQLSAGCGCMEGVGLALGEAFRSGFVFLSALAQTNGLSSYEYNKGTI